jgi:glycosyltransferase involved in cell wall biosynthesis
MNNNSLSLVIPTLNEEICLPLLLRDLVNQTDKNFEVIVVDAKSSDNTKKNALALASPLTMRFISSKRRNIAAQKNYGAEKTRDEYIIFLDADFRVPPVFISKIKRFINRHKRNVIMPRLLPDSNSFILKLLFRFGNFLILCSQYTRKPFSSAGCLIFNKLFFKQLGGFDETLYNAEDHEIIQRANQTGIRAVVLPDVEVISSLRRVRTEGWLKSFFKLVYATLYILFKGKIKKKIFEYEMGGQVYK